MALLKLNKSGRKLLGFCPLLFLPSQSTPETIPQWQQKQLPTEKCKRQNSQEENPILSIWWWDQTLFLFLSLPSTTANTILVSDFWLEDQIDGPQETRMYQRDIRDSEAQKSDPIKVFRNSWALS